MKKNQLLERMLGRAPVPSHSNGFIWTKSRHPRAATATETACRKGAKARKQGRTKKVEFADHWV